MIGEALGFCPGFVLFLGLGRKADRLVMEFGKDKKTLKLGKAVLCDKFDHKQFLKSNVFKSGKLK